MTFENKAVIAKRNWVSMQGRHLCALDSEHTVCEHVCGDVLQPVCVHAGFFIIKLIVFGSSSLWYNKLKLLNLFDADNAMSQGYQE